jgi:hypothetical protein
MQIKQRFNIIATPGGIYLDGEPLAESASLGGVTVNGMRHILCACEAIAKMTSEDWKIRVDPELVDKLVREHRHLPAPMPEMHLAMANPCENPWARLSENPAAGRELTLDELTKNNPEWMDELRDALGRFAASLLPAAEAGELPAKVRASARNNRSKKNTVKKPVNHPKHYPSDPYTVEQLSNIIYNEVGGLRGNADDLQRTNVALAYVVLNRQSKGQVETLGSERGCTLALDTLTDKAEDAVARDPHAIDVYARATSAAIFAMNNPSKDPTSGALLFLTPYDGYYYDRKNHKLLPDWASEKKLTASYGPFTDGVHANVYFNAYKK